MPIMTTLAVYVRVRWVRLAVTSITPSRQNLRHRSCCGQQQDRGGIAREVLPANGKRALNKFLTEYGWNEQQLNRERVDELQKHRGCALVEGWLHYL